MSIWVNNFSLSVCTAKRRWTGIVHTATPHMKNLYRWLKMYRIKYQIFWGNPNLQIRTFIDEQIKTILLYFKLCMSFDVSVSFSKSIQCLHNQVANISKCDF